MEEKDKPDREELQDLDLESDEGEEVAEQVRGGARRTITPT